MTARPNRPPTRGAGGASKAGTAPAVVPSIKRTVRLTAAQVAALSILVMFLTVFGAAGALYRWEIGTINAVLAGVNAPAKLAIDYLDKTQAQIITDGLLNSPGIYSAQLLDDFGDQLASSHRTPPDSLWVIDLMQAIWGQSSYQAQQIIQVSAGRQGLLTVDVMLGEMTGPLIQTSLIAILVQAALIIALVSATIYWTTSKPLVSGLRFLSSWISQTDRNDLVSLPPPQCFRFSEIHDSGLFIHSIVADLLLQRRDLGRTVGHLKEQVDLNEQYIGIIEQILAFSHKTALHISPAGRLTWYNPDVPGLGFLGDLRPEHLGHDLQGLVDNLKDAPEVRHVTSKAALPVLPGNRGRNLFDLDVELKDGRILQLTGIDLGDGGQALMISDETQLRLLAQETFQRQKLESLGLLASGVAHDMNNILAILSGTIELELGRNPSPETERSLVMARTAVSQGIAVVRTLLTFSRKTKAEVTLESASAILQDLQMILKGKIGGEVHVSCRIEVADAFITVDRPRLVNALFNLAINARDAIGERGHIGLVLRAAKADDDLPIGAGDRGGFVVFAVEDDGPGIPEHMRQRILDPFFTTKAAGKGTGLGLTLVYNVAEEFGGRLSFRSEFGHGACFMVALPKAAPDAVLLHHANLVTLPKGKGDRRSVLLVDDEPGLVEIAQTYLEARGYCVTVSTSVAEGLQKLAAGTGFDIIVTDLSLGDGTGADIARQARAAGHHSKIILISGNMDYGLTDDSIALFDASIEKPFAWSDLDFLIQKLLPARLPRTSRKASGTKRA